MMPKYFFIFVLFFNVSLGTKSQMEPKVINGERIPITSSPHSVFLMINSKSGNFLCGSSVINQKILLTAAHCIEYCVDNCVDSIAYAGDAKKGNGFQVNFLRTVIHEAFTRRNIKNDIGLILLKRALPLGTLIKRVALMRTRPENRIAILSGWGLLNESMYINTNYLHSVKQHVWQYDECKRMIPTLTKGTFCAGDVDRNKYAAEGDSGSALVVNKYIQIGIVSYKRPDISPAIVVYTDVSYFYSWIKKNSKNLYCNYL